MRERSEKIAELRNDFMRRWFAIAVSVGFAATVVQMSWVITGALPSFHETEQLARLAVALLATVLSWEGYLLSISEKKLYDIWRYLLDVSLVFLYLFLLLTSKFPYYWLALHALTFAVYILWDFLSIWWYREWFSTDASTSIGRVYAGSVLGTEGINRGPAITLVWALYFAIVWWAYSDATPYATFVYAGFVLIGLAGYRWSKNRRDNLSITYLGSISAAALVGLFSYFA